APGSGSTATTSSCTRCWGSSSPRTAPPACRCAPTGRSAPPPPQPTPTATTPPPAATPPWPDPATAPEGGLRPGRSEGACRGACARGAVPGPADAGLRRSGRVGEMAGGRARRLLRAVAETREERLLRHHRQLSRGPPHRPGLPPG